jgi:orotate phosphoribosyltransferase
MEEQILQLCSATRGHFLLESGHHGDLWLGLESLCLNPRRAQSFADKLAEPLSTAKVDTICGPLIGGAFLGLMVALALDVQFTYAERFVRPAGAGRSAVDYRVPTGLRAGLRGKRVAIVDDVINAGSAVRSTFADLEGCGAVVAGISALLVLGGAGAAFAVAKGVPLRSLGTLPSSLWDPADCPLCLRGIPLEDSVSAA